MNKHILENIIKYHNVSNKYKIDIKQAKLVFDCLLSYRYVLPLINDGHNIFRDLFSYSKLGNFVYPCDIIDLREILDSGEIKHNDKFVPLLPMRFAEKYLKQYSIFLSFDKISDIDIYYDFGQIKCCTSPYSIYPNIKYIILNSPALNENIASVRKIIKDTDAKVDFYVSNSVPGISSPNREFSVFSKRNDKMLKKSDVSITLTQKEKEIFDFLIREKRKKRIDVEMRVAGGWTRDKIMGINSDDIDIAISNMTGAEFSNLMFGDLAVNSALINANPEKSKHLETVKVKLFGQEIDFVNLRSETYADSRIPDMKMGTVEEDARRRDLTINALYYNIETGEIEDYVGGMDDLVSGVLRTPMDPVQTFLDDPLRMLRVLRFKSRFNDFSISPEIINAFSNSDVQDAYRNKVSPERAGKEIIKLVQGIDPEPAVRIMFETDLYKSVFNIPELENLNDIRMEQKNRNHKLNLMNHTLSVLKNINSMMIDNGEKDETRGLMNLAAIFHDFGKMHPEIMKPHPKRPDEMTYRGHEDMSATIAESALRYIGIGDKRRRFINKVIQMHMRPHGYPDDIKDKSISKYIRDSRIPGMNQEDMSDELKEMYEKIPLYTYYHAIADSKSKGSEDYHDDVDRKYRHIERINEFYRNIKNRPSISEVIGMSTGEFAIKMFPHIDPKTGFIREVKESLENAHNLGSINSYEQAEKFVKQLGIENRYPSGRQKLMSWYKQIKKSDASSGSDPGTNEDFHPYEGTPLADKDKEIVKMKRYIYKPMKYGPSVEKNPKTDQVNKNDVVRIPYSVGDRVRDRRKGLASHQRFGKVSDIKDNHIVIKWKGQEREEKIPLNQTTFMAQYLEKI